MSGDAGTWAQYQKLVLKLLEQHDEKLERLQKGVSDLESDKKIVLNLINDLKIDVELIFKVVRDGAPNSPSLTRRVEVIENELNKLTEKEEINLSEQKEGRNYRRAFYLSVFALAGAAIWDIVQRLFMGK